jgi:hypothetical protein
VDESDLQERVRRAEAKAAIAVVLALVLGFLSLGAAVYFGLSGQAGPSAVSMRAEQFVLVDGEGEVRGSWEVGEGGPYLSVVGADGRSRAVMAATADGPAVVLYDAGDVMRARMALGADQVAVDVWDEGGNQRAVISSIGGIGVVGVSDGTQGASATLTAADGNRVLTMTDDVGETVVQLGISPEGPVFQMPEQGAADTP